MDLNKITTQVRPRNHWQAVDLGFKMGKQWYGELIKGYIVVALPVFVLLNLVFFEMPLVAIFILWWLKPAFERIQLVFLSHALFGQGLNLKQQIAILLQTAKTEWLGSLTIQRISLRRSYYSPIRQLENQRGKSFSKRKMAFIGENDKAAFWLTFVLVHIESFIVFAMLALTSYLIPEQIDISIDIFSLEEQSTDGTIYNNALIFLSYCLMAPFYTASGFSLYLNQRTQIEGWDIEISFKRLIDRTQKRAFTSSLTTKSILMAMLIGSLTSFSEPSLAADSNSVTTTQNQAARAPNQQQAAQQIQEIIKSETFNQKETRSYPEAFLNLEANQSDPNAIKQFSLPDWLHSLIQTITTSIEWLLTLFVLTIIVIFVVRYRHWFAQFLPEGAIEPRQPKYKQVFGLDLPEQSTIEDVQQQARKLWNNKQKREALSLLYRASLQVLVNQEHIKLNDAFTEGECVRQVKQSASQTISQYFKNLTSNWQRLAYANQEPSDATLVKLIDQWSEVFISPTSNGSAPELTPKSTSQEGKQ